MTAVPPSARHGHFLALDGLRGVAALSVLILHRGRILDPGGVLPHAYLAVDFFFLLSGFVIAYAYDHRLSRGLGVWAFARLRLVRLYPMVLAATLVAAAYLILRERLSPHGDSPGQIAQMALTNALALPTLGGTGEYAYPLNLAMWSLAMELAANLAYAAFRRVMTTRVLVVIVGVFAAALVVAAFARSGLDVGATRDSFWWGAPRCGFGFFAGVLMFRLFRREVRPAAAMAPLALGALLVALFAVPNGRGYDPIFDLFCVFLVLPAVVWTGALYAGRQGAAACKVLGDLSYPLYVVQIPVLVWCQGLAQAAALDGRIPPKLFALLELGVALAAAWVMLKLFDEPVRRWLGQRLRTGTAPSPAGQAAAQQP